MSRRSISITVLSFLSLALAACGGGGGSSAASLSDAGLQGGGRSPAGTSPSGQRLLTETCASGDASKICIGLKYVVYKRASSGAPVVSEDTMVKNLARINDIWKTCGIGFQVEKYEAVDPTAKGLATGAAAADQTDAIRKAYAENDTFLLVTTENWNTTKNAWAQPPGAPTHGVVLEGAVGDYPSIIAHELGHYMNLDHVGGPSDDLMYYAIVANPRALTTEQCNEARASALRDWVPMLRK